MGSLLYVTHPLCVSHYCGVVTAVGLRGRLGGNFLCMAIEDEAVDSGERVQLGLRSGVGSGPIDDAGTIHRPREYMNRSSSSLWNLTARPCPAVLRRPSRTARHRVTAALTFVYCAASSYVR